MRMRILFLNQITGLRTRIVNTFTLPERFKGTVVEKWAKYWRGLISDYSDVVVAVVKESHANPRKAVYIACTSYAIYAAAVRNPDADAFLFQLRNRQNELILVSPVEQNQTTSKHLRMLEQAVNENRARTLSLGVCTLLWLDMYDGDDCTYPAVCEYTRTSIWNFHECVVDVGFWNRYWRLDWKMRNFDVNYL